MPVQTNINMSTVSTVVNAIKYQLETFFFITNIFLNNYRLLTLKLKTKVSNSNESKNTDTVNRRYFKTRQRDDYRHGGFSLGQAV